MRASLERLLAHSGQNDRVQLRRLSNKEYADLNTPESYEELKRIKRLQRRCVFKPDLRRLTDEEYENLERDRLKEYGV